MLEFRGEWNRIVFENKAAARPSAGKRDGRLRYFRVPYLGADVTSSAGGTISEKGSRGTLHGTPRTFCGKRERFLQEGP